MFYDISKHVAAKTEKILHNISGYPNKNFGPIILWILESSECTDLFTYATANLLKLTFLSSLNINLSII